MVKNKLLLPVYVVVSILFIFTGIASTGCDSEDKMQLETVDEVEEIPAGEEEVVTKEENLGRVIYMHYNCQPMKHHIQTNDGKSYVIEIGTKYDNSKFEGKFYETSEITVGGFLYRVFSEDNYYYEIRDE